MDKEIILTDNIDTSPYSINYIIYQSISQPKCYFIETKITEKETNKSFNFEGSLNSIYFHKSFWLFVIDALEKVLGQWSPRDFWQEVSKLSRSVSYDGNEENTLSEQKTTIKRSGGIKYLNKYYYFNSDCEDEYLNLKVSLISYPFDFYRIKGPV